MLHGTSVGSSSNSKAIPIVSEDVELDLEQPGVELSLSDRITTCTSSTCACACSGSSACRSTCDATCTNGCLSTCRPDCITFGAVILVRSIFSASICSFACWRSATWPRSSCPEIDEDMKMTTRRASLLLGFVICICKFSGSVTWLKTTHVYRHVSTFASNWKLL